MSIVFVLHDFMPSKTQFGDGTNICVLKDASDSGVKLHSVTLRIIFNIYCRNLNLMLTRKALGKCRRPQDNIGSLTLYKIQMVL